MKNIFKLFICLLILIEVSSVNAKNICESYFDKNVQPVKANTLWKQLANVPKVRDEYETSEAFENRVLKAITSISGSVIVEVPIQRQYITYNADTKQLDIQSYAFDNINTEYSGVFGYGTHFYDKIKYGSSDNIDIVFPSEETQLGSYIGKNAFGVKVRVRKVARFTKAIFEREDEQNTGLFPNLSHNNVTVISLHDITPEMAKHLKTTARAAIVYIPKAPYFAKGKYPWGEPTIEAPMDINETIEVAVGNIQCALLLNQTGKVYGVAATSKVAKGGFDSDSKVKGLRQEVGIELERWGSKNTYNSKKVLTVLGVYSGTENTTIEPEFALTVQQFYDRYIEQCREMKVSKGYCESLHIFWKAGIKPVMPSISSVIYELAPAGVKNEMGKIKIDE